jgi:serine/threonine protein kinase
VTTIGRYEVENELGEGGMAVVYAAHDPYMQRQVAIKVLQYQLTTDEVFNEYFQREAEAIAALEHPCIVPVFDFGWHGVQPYIVMRYMAGGTLEDRLLAAEVEPAALARIIDRVAAGLDAAHKQGIVHRDVKPSNILFDNAGEAYLADFGLAKFLEHSQSGDEGWLVGTPEYMSPEQVRGESLDGRSDIYGLGAVLYRTLAGTTPYGGDSATVRIQAHLVEPVPNIIEVRPDLQSAWGEIIGKAMAKDPAARYATAGEFAKEVQEVASGRWYMRKLVW